MEESATPHPGPWPAAEFHLRFSPLNLGTHNFVTPTRTFVNNPFTLVGFSRAGVNGSDLFQGPLDPAFLTWDVLDPIGPISGSGDLLQWGLSPMVTSGGALFFDTNPSPVTFTADAFGPTGSAYCFGDSTGANCPCSAFGAPNRGCANSSGVGGARLSGRGYASLTTETFRLEVLGVPGSKPGILLRGDSQVAIPAGDGILCAAGGAMRSHV